MRVLVINGGSSSIKVALFSAEPSPRRVLSATLDHLRGPTATLTVQGAAPVKIEVGSPDDAVAALFAWIADQVGWKSLDGVGHRIVFGGERYTQPCRLTDVVLADLRALAPYDPEHLPLEIELVERVGVRRPDLPQVGCFDTAFHSNLPTPARMLPLPRRLYASGVRRYGFHGLSYQYLLREIERAAGVVAARGRLVLAHLGNGASLAAVRDGRSVDTTMGFSPTGGIPMSTRSGDIDPGVVAFLARSEGMSAEHFAEMASHQSGLAGVSETSGDLRELIPRAVTDVRAAEAIELFCYEIKKRIGAFAAVLGGLDRLVFTGGIGEHAAEVRSRVCDGLAFLGVSLDAQQNACHAPVISPAGAAVIVQVIATDEELMVAEGVCYLLGKGP